MCLPLPKVSPVLRGLLALTLSLAPGGAAAQQNPFILDTLSVSVESRIATGVGAVQVVDAATIRSLPVRTVDEVLQWATGVDLQARSAAQADVSIRGSTFEQILVLVDGVRMSDQQTGHHDMALTIPVERIERIEILRGAASAMYGADAFGGVINVVTRDGRTGPDGQARLEGGTNGTANLALDAQGRVGEWRVGGAVSRDQSDGHRSGTDYQVTRFTSRASGALGAGTATVDVGYAQRDFGADAFYAPFPSYEETRTRTASARWVGAVGGGLTLEPRVSWRRHDDDFVLRRGDPEFFQNIHDSRRLTAELEGRVGLGRSGALSFGGEWARESLESTNLGDREQEWRALFGEVVVVNGPFQLQGGVRYDDRDDVGSFLSPSASARWQVSPFVSFRGSWGRAFRAPTWTDRFYEDPANIGTADLAVERGWTADLAAEVESREGALSATLFQREAQDLIDFARPDGADDTVPWRARNVAQATYRGLELMGRRQMSETLALQVSASWLELEARDADGFFSKQALRPIHREFVARAFYSAEDGSVLSLAAADRSRLGGGGGLTLDARVTVPAGEAELYLDALNLTEADYADVTGLPIPGRRFLVGIRTAF
jgi:iron complex outermembrane receptor protein